MNKNTKNENLSVEHKIQDSRSLESFINPENYIDYFDNKMPLDLDRIYDNRDSFNEVSRLVDVFRDLNRGADSNKEVFNNLLNLSYCRAAQFSNFGYYEIDSYPEMVFDTVDDIKTDSEFINRLIEKIKFNEVDNGLGDFNRLDNDFDRLMFADNVVMHKPQCARLCEYALDSHVSDMDIYGVDGDLYSEGAYEKLGTIENETLNSHYIELEVLSLFGVNMVDIKEESRTRLFDWGVNLTRDNYKRFKKITKSNSITKRVEMANALLSTEFGDDFGDSILNIAENANSDQSNEVFRIINDYRETSKDFSCQFSEIDSKFTLGAEKAMNERLADLLAVAAKVAKEGSMTVDVAPHRESEDYVHDGRFDIKIDSLDQIIDTMSLFLKSQRMMSGILSSKDTHIAKRYKKDSDKLYSQTYLLMNDKLGIAQFHVRRFGAGSFDRVIEHGNRNGTEATISWSINPNNPFAHPDSKDPDSMNVRFDREGRSVDESPGSSDRSPIRKDGIISLDIGSILGEKTWTSTIVGRTIAAGNIIRSNNNDNRGSSISLNHNTNYLPQEYGNADDFAWLAAMIEQKIVNSYECASKKDIIKIGKVLVKKSVDLAS